MRVESDMQRRPEIVGNEGAQLRQSVQLSGREGTDNSVLAEQKRVVQSLRHIDQ